MNMLRVPTVCLALGWATLMSSPAATFTVTSTNDSGAGTLRQAMLDTISSAGPDTINFNIAGSPPFVVAIQTGLPVVPSDTSIFADTQPGYALTNPVVRIVPGAENGKTQDVFRLANLNVHVRGFHITGFTNNSAFGINGNGNKVAANLLVNNLNGVWISGGDNNLIGGYVVADRNIISSNRDIGVRIDGFGVPTGNTVAGNFIGTDRTGSNAWPNRLQGISAYDAPGTIICGTSTAIQVISGNPNGGVGMGGTNATGSRIYGNFIGVDASGMKALSNYYGVVLDNAVGVTLGGNPTQGFVNVISGNDYYGVVLRGTNAWGNVIMGNLIGVGTNGLTPVPNRYTGVVAGEGAYSNRIGGTNLVTANVIGGNGGTGISLSDPATRDNTVSFNYLGMSRTFAVISNGSYGIEVLNAPSNTIGSGNFIGNHPGPGIRIGGTNAVGNRVWGNLVGLDQVLAPHPNAGGIDVVDAPGTVVGSASSPNYIGWNTGDGISIRGLASNAVVQGNWVGVDPLSGLNALTNAGRGIYVEGARAVIGGTNQGNFVAGSTSGGIYLTLPASHPVIQGNLIGPSPLGSVVLGNAGIGVRVEAPGAVIGGPTATARNVISGNGSHGLYIGPAGTGAVIVGNYVGVLADGLALASNGWDGIRVEAPGALIGGTNPAMRNVVAGNLGGVVILPTGTNAVIQGNFIGVNAAGTGIVSNRAHGISIQAPGALIGGGATTNTRNVVSGNMVNGIEILAGAHGATIQGNYIGLDVSGALPFSNRQYGVYIDQANNVVVGGTGAARNVIGASRLDGIAVVGTSTNTQIIGNYIGTSAAGTNAIPNGGGGVAVRAHGVTIGGTQAGFRNLISGNDSGVVVETGRLARIIGNYIGTRFDGTGEIPNYFGIRLRQPSHNAIIQSNVIARNTTIDIFLENSRGGHDILGNYIGLQEFGVPYPTIAFGTCISIENSPSNRVGDGTSEGRNFMGRKYYGVELLGTGSMANAILGNAIGTDGSITEPAGFLIAGLRIVDASGNRIGGLAPTERNIIAHSGAGILVTTNTASALNNLLAPNLVYSNAPGLALDLNGDGLTANDALDADLGPNRLQNRPVVTNGITTGAGLVYAQGVLNSAPLTSYAVDLYRADGTNAGSRSYLGRTYVSTDAGGVGTFAAGFAINLAAGTYLSATATDPENNTSEFSISPSGLALSAATDGDNDNIPTYWENLYGLNPAVSNGPADDLDLDGYSDFDEYIADTAANDDTQYPLITAIAGSNQRQVTFPSSNLRTYKLEASSNLLDSLSWAQVGTTVTGLYGQTTMADPAQSTGLAYRVRIQLP